MNSTGPSTRKKTFLVYLGIIAITALFLLPFLGSVHLFDSDEVNYAESAREMILTGDYMNVQIDFKPFPEKPPLFFWLQVASMKLFGINEFAARFPNSICGIVTLIMLYFIGKRLYGHRFGLYWILTYGAAILPFFFFKSGIIDPWFNLFIFLGMAWFVFYLDPARLRGRVANVVLSGLFFGLAVLTKGPVALLIFLVCFIIFLSIRRFRLETSVRDVALFTGIVILVGGSWYFHQIFSGNSMVLKNFIRYQVMILSEVKTGHEGFFGYHLVVLLLGVFPASVISLKSFTKKAEEKELQRLFKQWMYIMFLVVIVLYSIAKTKLLHYSSLAYFPMTFLAAWVWEKWVDRKIEIGTWQVVLILFIALFYSAGAILFPLLADHYQWLFSRDLSFLDPFTRAALQRDVHWSGYEWIIGLFLLLGVGTAAVQILRRNSRGMLVLHFVVLLFVTAAIYTFTGRIEAYTQRVAIKYYKGLKGQEVYVRPLGFKSYSHLFYYDKQPGEKDLDVQQLMDNDLDRDAYFVIRLDEKDIYLERYPKLEVLLEKDGYVFTIKRTGFDMDPSSKVSLKVDQGERRVEVSFDGELFTAYRFEKSLEKPVLYPVLAPGGEPFTRGFPLEPREKERVDHPHHVGLWFNFGDVNGFDFWNNSYSVEAERKGDFGRIVHREIVGATVEGHLGLLEVKMDWLAPDTEKAEKLLEEHTTYLFRGTGQVRMIDRITRLIAVNGAVVFTDNKEGMLAIRTDRVFEHPSDKPLVLTDSSGHPSDVPVLDNEGVTGWYRNSNGDEGPEAWGKNARWVKLGATRGEQPYSIVIFDHPDNINYPSCWHARDYGLFSVNNLGREVYNQELDRFQLTLSEQDTLEFRHRIVVAAGDLSDKEIIGIEKEFTSE